MAAFLPTAIWAWLVLARGRYWSTSMGLPLGGELPDSWPRVAVIVPARNEADLLPETLPSLLGQDYPGEARVVLVDDLSTDGTAEVAAAKALNLNGCCLPTPMSGTRPRRSGSW
jgi:cellulose synthase/poly-beta-1,6-N-acetylglucosamine synthase-like glycosyltransferase